MNTTTNDFRDAFLNRNIILSYLRIFHIQLHVGILPGSSIIGTGAGVVVPTVHINDE